MEAANERTSTKLELKLLGVARGSLEELMNDYEDYLRQHGLEKWGKDDPRAKSVRALPYKTDWSCRSYQSYLSNPTDACNAMLCLINQCNFLLDRQIKALEEKFVKEGGWSEKIQRKREEEKKRRSGGPVAWARW